MRLFTVLILVLATLVALTHPGGCFKIWKKICRPTAARRHPFFSSQLVRGYSCQLVVVDPIAAIFRLPVFNYPTWTRQVTRSRQAGGSRAALSTPSTLSETTTIAAPESTTMRSEISRSPIATTTIAPTTIQPELITTTQLSTMSATTLTEATSTMPPTTAAASTTTSASEQVADVTQSVIPVATSTVAPDAVYGEPATTAELAGKSSVTEDFLTTSTTSQPLTSSSSTSTASPPPETMTPANGLAIAETAAPLADAAQTTSTQPSWQLAREESPASPAPSPAPSSSATAELTAELEFVSSTSTAQPTTGAGASTLESALYAAGSLPAEQFSSTATTSEPQAISTAADNVPGPVNNEPTPTPTNRPVAAEVASGAQDEGDAAELAGSSPVAAGPGAVMQRLIPSASQPAPPSSSSSSLVADSRRTLEAGAGLASAEESATESAPLLDSGSTQAPPAELAPPAALISYQDQFYTENMEPN